MKPGKTYDQRVADDLREYQEALERVHADFCAGDVDEQEYLMRCAHLTQRIKLCQELLEQPIERDSA